MSRPRRCARARRLRLPRVGSACVAACAAACIAAWLAAWIAVGAWPGERPGDRPGASTARTAAAPLGHVAFRILPWSRIEGAPGPDRTWRIALGPRARDVQLRVLGTSCACAGALVEDGVLCVTLRDASQARRVRVRLGVRRGALRALRTLHLVAPLRGPARPTLVVQHHLPSSPPSAPPSAAQAAAGLLHARLDCEDGAPPRLVSDAPLHAVSRPRPGGGWRTLVSGHASTRAVARPGLLVTSAGTIPLRVYRRAPDAP